MDGSRLWFLQYQMNMESFRHRGNYIRHCPVFGVNIPVRRECGNLSNLIIDKIKIASYNENIKSYQLNRLYNGMENGKNTYCSKED